MRSVLAVVAHPDDEVLGCGGALARHAMEGDQVSLVYFTDGVSSRDSLETSDSVRAAEALRAAKALGIGHVIAYAYRDQQLDLAPMPSLASRVTDAIRDLRADLVYTHWRGDLNGDHRRVAEAVAVATRPYACGVAEVRAFAVPESSLQPQALEAFWPDTFVRLEPAHLRSKLEALRVYRSESRPWPHPRSPDGARISAGEAGMRCGADLAEAFVTMYRRL